MRSKANSRDVAESILRDGQIIEQKTYFNSGYVLVKAFGKTFIIDDPYSKKPTITQLNVSKN